MSFTKPCNAKYDQLTHRRNHKLILRTNCYIALVCFVRVLPCVISCVVSLKSTYEDLCERPSPGDLSMNYSSCKIVFQVTTGAAKYQSISYPGINVKLHIVKQQLTYIAGIICCSKYKFWRPVVPWAYVWYIGLPSRKLLCTEKEKYTTSRHVITSVKVLLLHDFTT